MLARFLKDSAVYGVTGVTARAVGLFLVPLYTSVLAPADYGAVDMLLMFASLVNLTVALEISQAVARFYGAASARDRLEYASTALWFTVATFSVFWVAGAGFVGALGYLLLDAASTAPLMHAALAWIAFGGIFYLAQNQLRWELRPRAYAAASLTLTGVTVAVSVPLVLVARLGALGVVIGNAAGSAAGAVVALYLARRSYRGGFVWAKCREMLRFSLPLVPASVAVFVALYVDRIAIKQLMTLGDVGVFGIAYRAASIASLLLIGVQGALMPLVYSHHHEPETPAQLARIFRLFVAVGLALWLLMAAGARELISVFASPAYAPAASVVPILFPAILLAGMYVFAPGLAIAKRTHVAALITGSGAAVNTVLNLLLVPLIGIRGAAVATLVGAAAMFAGYMVTSQRLYRVPHEWRGLAGAAAAIGVAVLAVEFVPRSGAASFLLRGAIVLAGVFALFATHVVRPDELRRGLRHIRVAAGRRRSRDLAGPVVTPTPAPAGTNPAPSVSTSVEPAP